MKIIELIAGIRQAGRQFPGGFNRTAGSTKGSCRHRQMGLTLMELLIVVAIIGILSGIAVPFYFGQVEKARVIKAIAELDNIQLEIANFELDQNRLPDTLEEVRSRDLNDPWGNPYRYLNFATLENDSEAEEESPGQGKKEKGKAQGKDKKSSTEAEDPRRQDLFNEPLNTDYDLYSCGKDGKSAASITEKQSEDDIVRGQDGSYIGLASQFGA
jgi:general secretion pathway protein G